MHDPKTHNMETKRVYIVLRGKSVIPELTSKSEREAWLALGRWLMPTDVAIDGMTCTEVGRQAANGHSPVYSVQCADISW